VNFPELGFEQKKRESQDLFAIILCCFNDSEKQAINTVKI